MLNTPRLRNIYSKIQTELFYMIPEKWEKLYLYSSVIDMPKNVQNGELYFYYIPKGIFKKNPVNVYELQAIILNSFLYMGCSLITTPPDYF